MEVPVTNAASTPFMEFESGDFSSASTRAARDAAAALRMRESFDGL